MIDLLPGHFDVLRLAVHLARDRQLRTVAALRAALRKRGATDVDIDAALHAWGAYERSKAPRAARARHAAEAR